VANEELRPQKSPSLHASDVAERSQRYGMQDLSKTSVSATIVSPCGKQPVHNHCELASKTPTGEAEPPHQFSLAESMRVWPLLRPLRSLPAPAPAALGELPQELSFLGLLFQASAGALLVGVVSDRDHRS